MSDQFQVEADLVKEIVISSSPENMQQVEEFIDEIKGILEFRDDVYGNVMVAVTEAVNNSIFHGNQQDISKKVWIKCEAINMYRIQVSVADEGAGFDENALPDPTAPENLENPGGRGVFLMRHLADEINFLNNGRMVEMIFNV